MTACVNATWHECCTLFDEISRIVTFLLHLFLTTGLGRDTPRVYATNGVKSNHYIILARKDACTYMHRVHTCLHMHAWIHKLPHSRAYTCTHSCYSCGITRKLYLVRLRQMRLSESCQIVSSHPTHTQHLTHIGPTYSIQHILRRFSRETKLLML